jgi:hypothetical protein
MGDNRAIWMIICGTWVIIWMDTFVIVVAQMQVNSVTYVQLRFVAVFIENFFNLTIVAFWNI